MLWSSSNCYFWLFIVWAFDTETECWSLIEAKGDIPVGILKIKIPVLLKVDFVDCLCAFSQSKYEDMCYIGLHFTHHFLSE